jgi:FKBP-type peptidyl-prolyl cis-trans isomerase
VAGHTVKVTYVGTLIDGTIFDASSRHGDGTFTYTYGVGSVLPGFDEGVGGMKVGGTRRIAVPGNLAYGTNPQSGLPLNATLIFDLQLLAAN